MSAKMRRSAEVVYVETETGVEHSNYHEAVKSLLIHMRENGWTDSTIEKRVTYVVTLEPEVKA